MDLRPITIYTIVDLFLIGALLDIAFALVGGNKSTISRVWLDMTGQHPELIAELAYSIVLLYLHLNFAKFSSAPSFWPALAMAFLAVSPVLRMVFVIHTSEPSSDLDYIELATRSGTAMACLGIGGALLAVSAWWYLVPQHVTGPQ